METPRGEQKKKKFQDLEGESRTDAGRGGEPGNGDPESGAEKEKEVEEKLSEAVEGHRKAEEAHGPRPILNHCVM